MLCHLKISFLAEPSCNDGILNADETGIDCGGATCKECGKSLKN